MTDRLRTNWRVQAPLLAFLVVSVALALTVFRFFLLTFSVAASASLMLADLHTNLAKRLGGRDGVAAALLVLLVTVLILMPVFVYGILIGEQVTSFLDWLRPHFEAQEWDRFWHEVLPRRSPAIAHWLHQLGWQAPPFTAGLARASE